MEASPPLGGSETDPPKDAIVGWGHRHSARNARLVTNRPRDHTRCLSAMPQTPEITVHFMSSRPVRRQVFPDM